jgi:predicted nucleic acid-binding protein
VILGDSSAWIAFFRGVEPMASRVDEALAGNELALCGPVVAELRRGFSSAAARRRVLPLLDGCRTLEQPPMLWEEAGDLGFLLARRGVTVKTLDLLIATWALSHACGLLSDDRDFEAMVRAGVPLQLERPDGGGT